MTDPPDRLEPYNRQGTPEEEIIGRQLLEAQFPRLDEIHAQIDGPYMEVEPRSSLAIDDGYLGAYRGGMLQRGPINASWDALNTVRLVLKSNELPMTGMYPLLRAAIENAALAVWTLHPIARDERLSRLFKLIAGESHDQSKYTTTTGSNSKDLKKKIDDDLRNLIAARFEVEAEKAIFDPNSRRITDILSYCDSVMPNPDTANKSGSALAYWQLFSGLSHGKQWAFIATLDRSGAVVNAENEMAHLKQTSSTRVIAVGFSKGFKALEFALQCFGQGARAWTAQPEDAEEPNFRS